MGFVHSFRIPRSMGTLRRYGTHNEPSSRRRSLMASGTHGRARATSSSNIPYRCLHVPANRPALNASRNDATSMMISVGTTLVRLIASVSAMGYDPNSTLWNQWGIHDGVSSIVRTGLYTRGRAHGVVHTGSYTRCSFPCLTYHDGPHTYDRGPQRETGGLP